MKLSHLLEAQYYRNRDRYECPDCQGEGYQLFQYQFGEDDYDVEAEPCEMCDERGWISGGEVTQHNLDRDKLLPLTEAKYAFMDPVDTMKQIVSSGDENHHVVKLRPGIKAFDKAVQEFISLLGPPDWNHEEEFDDKEMIEHSWQLWRDDDKMWKRLGIDKRPSALRVFVKLARLGEKGIMSIGFH